MPLFTPIQKTQEEIKKDLVAGIVCAADRLYSDTEQRHTALFKAIWCNKLLTPQEIFDGMPVATRVYLFQISGGLQQVLSINPDYVPLVPPYFFTVAEDGGIIIGEVNPDGYVCEN